MTNPDKRKAREWWIKLEDSGDNPYWKVFGPGVWLQNLDPIKRGFTHVREIIPGEVTLTLDEVMPLMDTMKLLCGVAETHVHPLKGCEDIILNAAKALAQFDAMKAREAALKAENKQLKLDITVFQDDLEDDDIQIEKKDALIESLRAEIKSVSEGIFIIRDLSEKKDALIRELVETLKKFEGDYAYEDIALPALAKAKEMGF